MSLTTLHSTNKASEISNIDDDDESISYETPEDWMSCVWSKLRQRNNWCIAGMCSLDDKVVEFNLLAPDNCTVHQFRDGTGDVVVRMYLHLNNNNDATTTTTVVVPYVPRNNWRLRANEIWLNASRAEVKDFATVTEVICSAFGGCVFIETFGSQVHHRSADVHARHKFQPSEQDLAMAVDAMKALPNQDKRVYAASWGVKAATKAFGKKNVTRLVYPSEYIRGAEGQRHAMQTCRKLGILKPNLVLDAIARANTARWLRAGHAGGPQTALTIARILANPDTPEYKRFMEIRAAAGRAGGAVTGSRTTSANYDRTKMEKMWVATAKIRTDDPEKYYKDRAIGGWKRTDTRRAGLVQNQFAVPLPQTNKNRRLRCCLCGRTAGTPSMWEPHLEQDLHKSQLKIFESFPVERHEEILKLMHTTTLNTIGKKNAPGKPFAFGILETIMTRRSETSSSSSSTTAL